MANEDYKPALIADAVVAPIANGEVLVATADNRKALVLNDTGAVVVSLCNGECSLEQIAVLFADTLGVDKARAQQDVITLLQELHGEGLLQSAPPD
jgi:hypothetical protein